MCVCVSVCMVKCVCLCVGVSACVFVCVRVGVSVRRVRGDDENSIEVVWR